MKRLYLTRHGETLFNQLHRIQGASDSPLTAKGIAQAKAARGLIAGVEFDHYYTSTQERAVDTLEIMTEYQKEYRRLKGLKEFDFGVFEGQSEQLNPKVDPTTGYGDFFVQYGGESSQGVGHRMNETLLQIMQQPDHQQVLAVSHGGAIYNFARIWLDTQKELGHGFRNLSTIVMDFDPTKEQFFFVKLLTLAEVGFE